jgi:hypothetical protein
MPCPAVPCCAMALRSRLQSGIVGARQGHGMIIVNQTRSHCFMQTGNIQSKSLARRHGGRRAGTQHRTCELAITLPLTDENTFDIDIVRMASLSGVWVMWIQHTGPLETCLPLVSANTLTVNLTQSSNQMEHYTK